MTLKIQGHVLGQGPFWWSYVKPRIQSTCLHFVLWQSDHFGCDIVNSIFDLVNKVNVRTKIDQNLIRQSIGGGINPPQNKRKSEKLFGSYHVNKSLLPAAAPSAVSSAETSPAPAYEPVQKHSHPDIPGWLDKRSIIIVTFRLIFENDGIS